MPASKLTDELRERVALLIRAGNTVAIAAEATGIADRTIHRWLERGEREQSGPYVDFAAAVERARVESEAVLVARLSRAARNGSWRAAAWLLERRWPERWAKATRRGRA